MTETMGGVSHTHREDPRNVFSEMFRRGQSTQSDGGRSTAGKRRKDAGTDEVAEGDDGLTEETAADDEMRHVDHEAPDDEGAARVWERGTEADEE